METPSLQYRAELVHMGMVDGPPGGMLIAERLQKLRDRQTWLDRIHQSPTSPFSPPSMMLYDLQQGVFTVGDGSGVTGRPTKLWFRKMESRIMDTEASQWSSPDLGFEILELTTDPSQDLVALLQSPMWVRPGFVCVASLMKWCSLLEGTIKRS